MKLDLNSNKISLPYDPNKEYDAVVIGGGTGGKHYCKQVPY